VVRDQLVLCSLECSGVFCTDTKPCPYSLLVTFLKHEYAFRAVTIIEMKKIQWLIS